MRVLLGLGAIAAFGIVGVAAMVAVLGAVVVEFWAPILLIVLAAIFRDQIKAFVERIAL